IERTPPRIELALGEVGSNHLYLKFSEPVFGARDRNSDIVAGDFNVPGNAPLLVDPISRSPIGAGAVEGITEADLYLTNPLTADDFITGLIRPAGPNLVFDRSENSMPITDQRRLSDVLIGVVEPVWATDSFGTNDAGPGEFRTIREFDGSKELSRTDITLQGRLLTSILPGLSLNLVYDTDVASTFRTGSTGQFWAPERIPGLLEDNANTNAREIAPFEITNNLRTFHIPGNDPGIIEGEMLEFQFRVGTINAARLSTPGDLLSLAPWRIKLGTGFVAQRSNVTILNNVIFPEKGERTILVYELDRPGMVTVQVFSLDGSLVRTLQRGRQTSSTYRLAWDGRNNSNQVVARGIYFIRVVAPGVDEYRKVIIAK
ncbi:MAG: FlgD immunoglobulin-like domain containing protein, partial [Alkalispirochaeta sp.]